MPKVICPVKNVEIHVPQDCGECVYFKEGTCMYPNEAIACTGISCIWCYLAKEGVKKVSTGIRKWKASRAR